MKITDLPINNNINHLKTNNSVHKVPANKEWSSAIYVYNKTTTKNIPVKNKIAFNLINSYFNMNEEKKKKSKRLSDLIRKSTTRKTFVSKIETKQNNDKSIITVYLFDREKQYLNKQMILDLNMIKTIIISNIRKKYKIRDINKWQLKKEKILNIITKSNVLYNKNMMISYKLKKQSTNIFFNKRYQDYNVNKNLVLLKNLFNIDNKVNLYNYFVFNYLVWVLSIFNFIPNIVDNKIKLINCSNALSKKQESDNEVPVRSTLNNFLQKISHSKSLNKRKKIYDNTRLTLLKHLIPNKKTITYNKIDTNNIQIVNNTLFKFLNVILKNFENNLISRNKMINNSFRNFIFTYLSKYNLIFKNVFNREFNLIDSLNKWIFLKRRFSSLIPYLKVLLSKIYDNSIELNLVNLKYIQLNGNLLSSATVIKLRKRKAKLLEIMRRSMGLARLPKIYKIPNIYVPKELDKSTSDIDNMYLTKINSYKGININSLYNNESYHNLFSTLFNVYYKGKNNTNEELLTTNINNNLNQLGYKWLTGIKLEANGRLTKRFTASRALHKVKIKGSLQNYNHLKRRVKYYQKPNVVLLRGLIRPNLQYSFITSTKRVGAFGLKSWISSN